MVYAGGEDYGPGGRELQAGLMGVIGGVAGMEDYYRAGQTKNAVNANEEILVGTKTVSRNAVNRNAFGEEIQKAGALGYSALQTVAQHQLPMMNIIRCCRLWRLRPQEAMCSASCWLPM